MEKYLHLSGGEERLVLYAGKKQRLVCPKGNHLVSALHDEFSHSRRKKGAVSPGGGPHPK